jgi:ribosomal protein L40E
VFLVVYCQKCSAENADDADFCKKCGAPLTPAKKDFEAKAEAFGQRVGRRAERWGQRVGTRAEEECFGVTGGGAIFGIIFGLVIIGIGTSFIFGYPGWLLIGPIVTIIFGVLIVVCALNSVRRKRSLMSQED